MNRRYDYAARRRALRVRPRVAILAFVPLFVLTACWSVSTPMYASADEPSHVTKAAAVVRGQVFGQPARSPSRTVHVPLTFAADPAGAPGPPTCFVYRTEQPASCQRVAAGSRVVSVPTYAGRYPPLYYFMVGWPSLLSSSTWTLYAMRLVSAAICSAFLAAGLAVLWATGRRWLVLGWVVATTPMVLYFAGMVNPSGLEMASGLCLWSAAIAWLCDPRLSRPCAYIAAVAGFVLAQTRPVSVTLLVLIAVTVAMLGVRVKLRPWMAPIAVAAVFGAVWTLAEHATVLNGSPVPASFTTGHIIALSVAQLDSHAHQLIGVFGWLESPTASWTFYAWLLAAGFLIYSSWSLGGRRVRRALVLLVLILLIVPVLYDLAEARTHGLIYQSRYLMPYLLGIPLVAAYGLTRSRWRPPAILLVVTLGIGQVTAFVQVLQRYTVGSNGTLLWFTGKWSPPYVGAIAPVVVFSLALAALLTGALAFDPQTPTTRAVPAGHPDEELAQSS